MAKDKGKKIESFKNFPLDIFEAMRRAMVHRGKVRRKPVSKTSEETFRPPKRLRDITIMSHDILFKADTVFPFTFFPDTVCVDREKLTIASRSFFRVAKITSIPVRDLLSVEADVGPFFGSVHVASRFFNPVPYAIRWLRRKDAERLHWLLQGGIIALEQKVDASNLNKEKMTVMLIDLGKGDTD